jgi:hypothetical protein
VLPLPSAAAPFSVAATSASGMLIPSITHARFITVGCIDQLLLIFILIGAQFGAPFDCKPQNCHITHHLLWKTLCLFYFFEQVQKQQQLTEI